jgi:hypothetical protein
MLRLPRALSPLASKPKLATVAIVAADADIEHISGNIPALFPCQRHYRGLSQKPHREQTALLYDPTVRASIIWAGLSILIAAFAITGCGGASPTTETKTVTETATAISSPSITAGAPRITPSARPSDEEAFISTLTMFSGYWAMRSSDTNSLIALAHTTCNWIRIAKADGTLNNSQVVPVVAVNVRQSFSDNPPSVDDAETFVNSSLNIMCNELVHEN